MADEGIDKAREAQHEAALQLQAVQSRWPTIHSVVRPLKRIREANHFAEQLQRAFGRA